MGLIENSGVLLFVICLLNVVASDHHPDHSEESEASPTISLDLDTVTEIINALDSEIEQADQETEIMLEVTPSTIADIVYNYAHENHPDQTFEKRRGHASRSHRGRKTVVVESSVHADVHPNYYPDEHENKPGCPHEQPSTCPGAPKPQPCPHEPEETHVPPPPCETSHDDTVQTSGENEGYGYVGSLKGEPGVHYPNYTEIPLTSFTCADKKHIPGFYADLETRCQVFHVCYPHRRESFLCPLGTTFNQPILACDYWYNGNCSRAPEYYDQNEKSFEISATDEKNADEILTIVEDLFEPEEQIPVSEEPVPVHPPKPVEPVIVKEVKVQVSKSAPKVVIPEPVQVVEPAKVVAVSSFLPVKAKVITFTTPLASASIKAKVMVAKPVKAVPVAKVVKAAAAKKLIVKPLVLKKAVAKKLVLAKAKKAAIGKILLKKAAVSALTKKHLALSLLNLLRAHNIGLHAQANFGPVYYV